MPSQFKAIPLCSVLATPSIHGRAVQSFQMREVPPVMMRGSAGGAIMRQELDIETWELTAHAAPGAA
jgi:hypothetical protein